MQALFALSGGARKNALRFKIKNPFMNIRRARHLISDAIAMALEIMGKDSDQAEKLILHNLEHDEDLQQAVNRLMVAMLMRDIDYSPLIAKQKIIEMESAMKDLYGKFARYRRRNELPYCELTRDICCDVTMVREHLKDARKAVA
ncbi:MAG: hypothetical protein HRU29_01600 [Rhizobiales bacterium]|nr:hypothetical protein [Hyphomicrobiales bacterium]